MNEAHITSTTLNDDGTISVTYTFTINGTITDHQYTFPPNTTSTAIKTQIQQEFTNQVAAPSDMLTGQTYNGTTWQ